MLSLLPTINSPADLRALPRQQLRTLADELRSYLLQSVAKTGGHLSSNLGTVELTVALHYVFNTPDDRVVWDVGHQTYPHKILTGRRDQMATLRQRYGLSGFPKRDESAYDAFGTAHSSTSISAALGMALASQQKGEQRHAIAVIGDGAMTAGMAGGQAIDLASVGMQLNEDQLRQMHRLKTGALLQASVMMGAACGQVSPQALQGLQAYGQAVGLAFQVVDDILDVTADSNTLGKTAGKDAANHKPTYVSLLGLGAARDYAQALLNEALAALTDSQLTRTQALTALAQRVVNRNT
jgi:hypothetical protein